MIFKKTVEISANELNLIKISIMVVCLLVIRIVDGNFAHHHHLIPIGNSPLGSAEVLAIFAVDQSQISSFYFSHPVSYKKFDRFFVEISQLLLKDCSAYL